MAAETSWTVTYTPVGGSSTTAKLNSTNQYDAARDARALINELVLLGRITGVVGNTATITSDQGRALSVPLPGAPPPPRLF